MPQSEEDFIKKSKYITDRILVRDFFQWESFFLHPLRSFQVVFKSISGSLQGGIKFEISWEPNFQVNNFARNNGKNPVIIKNQRKVVTNDKTGQKVTV